MALKAVGAEVTIMPDEKTLADAVAWLAKAQQLGFYNSNVVRLTRVAAEAVANVLDDSEPKTLDYVRAQLEDQMYVRMVNKTESISADTAKTYIGRTLRLIRDYEGWLADPRSYRPKAGVRRTSAPERRARTQSEYRARDAGHADDESDGYAEHTLPLQEGRAYFRLPPRISADDYRLIMMVVASHCPDLPRREPSSEPPSST